MGHGLGRSGFSLSDATIRTTLIYVTSRHVTSRRVSRYVAHTHMYIYNYIYLLYASTRPSPPPPRQHLFAYDGGKSSRAGSSTRIAEVQ